MTNQTPAAKPATKKLRDIPVVVAKIEQETWDTVSIFMRSTEDFFSGWDYKAGQFVSIDPKQFRGLANSAAYLELVKGKRELPRAYSLGSYPGDEHIIVTVKWEQFEEGEMDYPPLLSGYLVHSLREGDAMVVRGFAGAYIYPDDIEERNPHVVHIASGSGIVPNYGLLKAGLHEGLPMRHTMLYSNRTYDDIIYREKLEKLAQQYPDKFKLVHHITREPDAEKYGPNYRAGRITIDDVKAVIGDDPTAVEVYACGSAITKWEKKRAKATGIEPNPKFMEHVRKMIGEIGVPKKQFHKEEW